MATGIGEIATAARFFLSVRENVRGADEDFRMFAETAQSLGNTLKELENALKEQESMIANRGGAPYAYGGEDFTALHDILGNFALFQHKTATFLQKHKLYSQTSKRAILKKSTWKATGEMKREIKDLISHLSFYCQHVLMALHVLRVKMQSQMDQKQEDFKEELRNKLNDLLRRFGDVPADLSQSSDFVQASSPTNSQLILTKKIDVEFQWLNERFQQEFDRNQNSEHVQSLSLSKIVDLSIWWYLEGKDIMIDRMPTAHDQEEFIRKYINLSKAYWLLLYVTCTDEFKKFAATSFWSQYIGSLSEKISDAFIILRGQLPSLVTLQAYAARNHHCWDLELGRSLNVSQTAEGPQNGPTGSQDTHEYHEIVRIDLPGYPTGEVDRRVTVLQDTRNPDWLKVEDLNTIKPESALNASRNVPSERLEAVPYNRNETQLIPSYVWNPHERLTIKLRLGETTKPSGFQFSKNDDLFSFQKTFTAFNVMADIPYCKDLKFKTGLFSEKSYGANVTRIQVWFEDLRCTHPATTARDSMVSPFNDGASTSAATGTSILSKFSHSSTIMPVKHIEAIETSYIVLYTVEGDRQTMFCISQDTCKIDHKSCCSRRGRILPDGSRADCCTRTVVKGINGPITLLKLSQKSSENPLGIPLKFLEEYQRRTAQSGSTAELNDMKAQPGAGEMAKVQVKWLTVNFKGFPEKATFVGAFNDVRRLKTRKSRMQNNVLHSAKVRDWE